MLFWRKPDGQVRGATLLLSEHLSPMLDVCHAFVYNRLRGTSEAAVNGDRWD
jgi:hypothetical protein